MSSANPLVLPEAAARRLLLVRAIETVDTQGKLLSPVERDQLEQRALDGIRVEGQRLDAARYLQARAGLWLDAVENRNPRLAALQHPPAWQRWLAWGLPAIALLLGAALDRIDNPHQVNLLSPPLLAFLFWNLLVYGALLAMPFLPRRAKGPARRAGGWLGWLPEGGGRAGSNLRSEVAAQFNVLWLRLAGGLEARRGRLVLHTSALAWAIGVALSIAIGGLVREYRVGWESTLLNVDQVHAFLRVLFAPVTALFPVEPFSLAELQRLHFRSGAEVGPEQARRWVGLYIGLLLLAVALPRAMLALHSGWERWRLGRALQIDLADAYFAQVLGRVSPARVLLCVLPGQSPQRAALLQALRPPKMQSPGAAEWALATTARGDELRILDLPADTGVPETRDAQGPRLLAKWLPRRQPAPARQTLLERVRAADLLVAADPAAAQGELAQWAGRPLLVAEPAACWFLDDALLQSVARRLPSYQAPGMARLAQACLDRHQDRLAQATHLLAAELVRAARDSEEVHASPINLRRLIDPAERDAGEQARRAAMQAVLERLGQSRMRTYQQMLDLHGVTGTGSIAASSLGNAFRVHEAVDSPQAGMAGAASGAALGATVDLMVGGITLGAAAALGALVGGGAAYVAAAWKNRSASSGASAVQLGDDMLQGLTELLLLQYLAVIHQGRSSAGWPEAAFQREVAAAIGQARPHLQELWTQARNDPDPATGLPALAKALQASILQVLQALYGPAGLRAS